MKRVSVFPNIYAECARENISQEQLAARLGVNVKTLYNWHTGTTPIPSTAVLAMARMWNVTADYILSRTCRKEVHP